MDTPEDTSQNTTEEATAEDTSASSDEIVNLEELGIAVNQAYELMLGVRSALARYLTALTAEERKALPPAPHQIGDAGRSMIKAAQGYPVLLAATPSVNSARVINRLDQVLLLAPLSDQAESIARLIDDTRQKLLSTTYTELLSLYRVGKSMAQEEPEIHVVIKPLAEIFAARKRPNKPTDKAQ